jgi:hypothetical protein
MTRAACAPVDGVLVNPSQPTAITLSGTTSLTLASHNGNVLYIDPGGAARTINLYAANLAPGAVIDIINAADAAETITVKKADGSTTLCTIAQNRMVRIVSDIAAGDWVFLANFTISLTSGA